jgi:hypothetical protein
MLRGPPPEKKRAASPKAAPKSKIKLEPDHLAEVAAELQARKLSRLYFFCRSTAISIAALAFGVCR